MAGKLIKSILLISLLFNISILGAAGYFFIKEKGCAVFPGAAGRKGAKLAKRLELTPEQRSIIEKEDAQLKKTLEEIHESLNSKRNRLIELLKEDKPDRDSIKSTLSEITELQAKIEALVVDHLISEKSILNKEQQAKYIELLERRFKRTMPHKKR